MANHYPRRDWRAYEWSVSAERLRQIDRSIGAELTARDLIKFLLAESASETVRDRLHRLGLDGAGIDTALPQQWVDDMRARTGFYAPGRVVWSYQPGGPAGNSGGPGIQGQRGAKGPARRRRDHQVASNLTRGEAAARSARSPG